jgi:hypothetical protein
MQERDIDGGQTGREMSRGRSAAREGDESFLRLWIGGSNFLPFEGLARRPATRAGQGDLAPRQPTKVMPLEERCG